MNRKQFYHRCLLAMLLASGLNVQAASPSLVDDELAIKPPPRSINDVTRMLSDYRQHDDLVRKLTAVADASAPASSERPDSSSAPMAVHTDLAMVEELRAVSLGDLDEAAAGLAAPQGVDLDRDLVARCQ